MDAVRVPPLTANIGSACYACFKEPGPEDSALSRCSGCKRVSYCSARCQKSDWASHKQFCKAWQAVCNDGAVRAAARSSLADAPSTDFESLNTISEAATRTTLDALHLALRRPTTISERNLLGSEPRCLACTRTDRMIRAESEKERAAHGRHALKSCSACDTAFYCSPAHWDAVKDIHMYSLCEDGHDGYSQCQMNMDIRVDLRLPMLAEMEHGTMPWAPTRQKGSWESLVGKTWAGEFGEELRREHGSSSEGDVGPFLRAGSEGLSMAMTIVWALEKLNEGTEWTQKEELVIHIMGAYEVEMRHSMVFEEILHRLPKVKRLRIVMCGPQLKEFGPVNGRTLEKETCPNCSKAGRKRIQEHYTSVYHDFAAGDKYTTPDLAVAFNSGCSQNHTESWKETIKVLVAKKIPAIFTAYHGEEAKPEGAILKELGAKLAPELGPCKNPWGSLLAKPEPLKVTGFYAVNGWLAGGFRA